ncbi:MAG: YqgE/AlgH family protein [Candidatus Rokuibacteriota bacterium]
MTILGAGLVLALAGMDMRAAAVADSPGITGELTGQLLVATPILPDPRFMRTVIYMVRHDETGAMGLVLNRPMSEIPLARLLDQLGIQSEGVNETIRFHYGGPVQRERGLVLHTADYRGKSTQLIQDGVALTWEPEIFRALATGAGPRRRLFALGYSGWGAGQLESEMRAGHWVAVPADEELLFDDDYDGKWSRAMARLKINL